MERSEWKLLAADVEKALVAVGKEHGVNLEMKGWRYSDTTCNYKLEAAVQKVGGKKFDPDKDNWKLYARHYGLKETDYGKVVRLYGHEYKLTGIKLKARRFQIAAEEVGSGRRYKLAAEDVRNALAAQEKEKK